MDRLQEIEARKLELRELLEDETKEVNLEEVKSEIDSLNAEVKQIEDSVAEEQEKENKATEERKLVAQQIEQRKIQPKEIEMEEIKMEERKFGIESTEYRSAFLKSLMGKDVTPEERSVITTATENSAGNVIPTTTENMIFEKVSKKAPMLDEVTLLNVRGNVEFAVETARTDGADHTEGASITESGINLTKVSLAGAEIVKLVTISQSVKTMTIDAFEDWLTNMLADSIANAIEGKIIATLEANGTAVNKSVSADTIRETIGTLPSDYDNGAKFYVNKKVFFTSILGLQDASKSDIVTYAGGKYYVYGYEVVFTDKATKVILANAKKFVANVPQSIEIKNAYNIANNTYSYSGVAMYDGKLADSTACIVLGTASV